MITLNYGSSIFYGANLYDLICILTHESDHIQNYNNGQSYNTVASEFYALTAEIYSEYFQYTSERYKEGIQNQHHYYANLYYNLYY
jgi:predicted SprT family Zn-dependent metalloprotease